ncbi:MAG: diaminopimelate decarboxylase [Muribaculaceae bacterium]|nr:diaminopimelate decarboxylase [Muribaculaceae bacterium]
MFPIEDFSEVTTPFYYYDIKLLRETLATINGCIASRPAYRVHYALKANANGAILDEIALAGLGADCVSGGEVKAAIDAGIPADKVVFAGVGKTDAEIRLGLEHGIACFNVESVPELEVINELAGEAGKKAPVAFRVNPDIDAHTHKYITTGTSENKFGIPLTQIDEVVALAQKLENIEIKGLHFHIGSQLLDMTPYAMLAETINRMLGEWEAKGVSFKTINVGGGLGIDYNDPDGHPIPDFEGYFRVFDAINLRDGQELHFELGRSVVAQCGSLITRVTYVKQGVNRKFAIVDGGFTDLIRPALYQAHHNIETLTARENSPVEKYDVVGPICESTDCFARDEELPEVKRGDLLALRSAGAYGQIMASRYNLRELPASFYDLPGEMK